MSSRFFFGGKPMPQLMGTVTDGGAAGSALTLDVSSLSLQENDVLVVFLGLSGNDASFDMTGFTEVCDLSQTGPPGIEPSNLHVGYKVQGSSVDTSVDMLSSSGSQEAWAAIAMCWRSVDTSSVLSGSAQTLTEANTILADPPSITLGARDVVIACGAGASSAVAYTSSDLSDFTTSTGTNGGFGNQVTLGAGWNYRSIDPAQFGGPSDAADFSNCSCSFALKA